MAHILLDIVVYRSVFSLALVTLLNLDNLKMDSVTNLPSMPEMYEPGMSDTTSTFDEKCQPFTALEYCVPTVHDTCRKPVTEWDPPDINTEDPSFFVAIRSQAEFFLPPPI